MQEINPQEEKYEFQVCPACGNLHTMVERNYFGEIYRICTKCHWVGIIKDAPFHIAQAMYDWHGKDNPEN